jgi:putative transcriptional regulator
MENNLELNNRIRMWRAEKRLSQGDLAEMVGVSRQTISSIENLQFCPSAKLALLICVALDKKFEDVFYFE